VSAVATGPRPVRHQRARRVADAVYGTILVLAVVLALSKDREADAATILGGALATAIVFWIVHVYAEMLDRRASGETTPTWSLVKDAAWQEWPLVRAALLPMAPLLLGAFDVFSRSTAVTLSLAIGIANLAAWGYIAGRAVHQSWIKRVATALGAAGLGALLVLLKNLVH
jgi:hypothetical protein